MKFLKQFRNSGIAVSAIILIVGFFMLIGAIPFDIDIIIKFLIGAFLLAFGQAIFLSAIDESVIKVGKLLGNALMKKRKVWLIVFFGFLFGLVIAIAEPDVQLLVGEVVGISPFLSTWLLMSIVGIGSGLFVCFGLVRILKNIPIKWIMLGIYGIIMVLCFIAPTAYIGISFDLGQVTTGSVAVPFILALAAGFCAIRGNNGQNDTFGLVAITSAGPILAILILGIIVGNPASGIEHAVESANFTTTLINSAKNVCLAFAPLLITFLITQFTLLKLDKKQVIKILLGFVISAIGLIFFLTGIYYGFNVMGEFIGSNFTSSTILLVLFGLMIGLCIVFTDPSIVILTNQVEEITSGIIKKKVVFITLGIGIALAIAVSFLHIVYQINILYFIIPLYALAIILNFIVPNMFGALSFDSGSVSSGVMAVAFILPICIGLCQMLNINLALYSFGIIGIIATVPILTVQILGVIYKTKQKKIEKAEAQNEKN